jgi:hypothetical protein
MSCFTNIWSKRSTIKQVGQNIEWPGLVGIIAFLTLGFMSMTQGYPYFALAIIAIGIFFVCLASYNSYRNKSTELVDRYEERFFVKMKRERKLAAQYLLGEIKTDVHLKYVLDFFEAPIADKVISKQIDVKQVYTYFRHWIILYWIASQADIESYCKKDLGAWGSLHDLYNIIVDIEKKELGTRYVEWDSERLKSALKDEASLL